MERERSGRFLVVDDEEVWRRHVAVALGPFGEVVTLESQAAALAAMETQSFLGFVVDAILPDGSGFAIIEAARARRSTAPALVLTSHHDREQVNRAHSLQAEFVCKPPAVEQLAGFGRRAVVVDWTGSRRVASLIDDFSAERHLTPRETEIVAA